MHNVTLTLKIGRGVKGKNARLLQFITCQNFDEVTGNNLRTEQMTEKLKKIKPQIFLHIGGGNG